MFPNEPTLSPYIDNPQLRDQVGDIRQPWIDLGNNCGISPFAAKALFALGMMRRYILSANIVLKDMEQPGFISAYSLLSSGVELLGRCIHPDKSIRQHPKFESPKRLEAGFKFIKRPLLPADVVVETNHYVAANGGYSAEDLSNLRNLVTHGGCITPAPQIKSDVELLHELRKAFYGVPTGETDPHEGKGPLKGALDRYYDILASGDAEMCDRLATAAISPVPYKSRKDDWLWLFDAQIIDDTNRLIEHNLAMGLFPISGSHTKGDDAFQLYY